MTTWRKTVHVLFVVHLLTSAGFSLVIPFLPLYAEQLGAGSPGDVKFWSGVIFSAPAITMMLVSPLWGFVADRRGRKLMLVRSTLAGALLLSLMGFARSVEELAVLRALQGLLTGNIAASNALVASTIPREHAGESLGFLRTATWVGMGVGPFLGGTVGALVGFRESFWVTGALLLGGCALVAFFVREDFRPAAGKGRRGFLAVYAFLLRSPAMVRLFGLSFLHGLARSMLLPVLPLLMVVLAQDTLSGSFGTGLLFGLKAAAGVAGGLCLGRLGDRMGHGRVVLAASLLMVLSYLPQPFVTSAWQLVAFQTVAGIAAVGIVPGVSALFSLYLPEGAAGATFGLESSVDGLARAIGPMMGAGLAMWVGLKGAFFAVAAIYVGVAILAAPLYSVVARPEGPAFSIKHGAKR